MGFEIRVSIEQLQGAAESLRAMADDCEDGLPAADDTPAVPQAAAQPSRPQDELATSGRAATNAYLAALRQAAGSVRQVSDALRSTAADYQRTDADATDLIAGTIGKSLGTAG